MAAELLARWTRLVDQDPDAPAWWVGGTSRTRGQLHAEALALAADLGDRVAGSAACIDASNGLEQVGAVLACWMAGLLPAVVAAGTSEAERSRLLAGWSGGPSAAWLAVSGGTTGRPKLLPSTVSTAARNLAGDHLLLARLGWRSGQRQLQLGDPGHTAFLYHAVLGLLDGNLVAELERFEPVAATAAVAQLDIEWLLLTPHHMARLRPHLADRSWLRPLRAVVHTGAPCARATKAAWLEAVDPVRVHEVYGATEGRGITVIRGDEWLAHPGSVGKGFLTEVRILDDAGTSVGPGTIGRVHLRSTRSGARLASVGDLGYLDDGGYLHLVGRDAESFKRGGAMVYPGPVEELLAARADVADAVAFGIPSGRLGRRLVAAVQLSAGACTSERELRRFCRQRLAAEQVPSRFLLVPEIPRSASGKVSYAGLRRLAADG